VVEEWLSEMVLWPRWPWGRDELEAEMSLGRDGLDAEIDLAEMALKPRWPWPR
jgi:hypothetical protein